MNFKNVLVLSPHTDDGELGAGGTMARLLEEGAKVHYVAFTAPLPEIKDECEQALKMLRTRSNGVSVTLLNLERRDLPSKRQEILQFLYEYNEKHGPDLVLTPSLNDKHQDHETVTKEAIRAFQNSTILGYILKWNCRTSKEDVLVQISETNLHSKIASILQYRSQIELRRTYFSPDLIKSEAYVRGLNFPSHYAEAFELIQLIYP